MSYVAAVLADSPIAYWRLNESAPSGAGSIIDSSGNGYHVSPPASGITWGEPGALGENSGAAALFGGTSNISASAAGAAMLGSAAWTIEMWFFVPHGFGGRLFGGAVSASNRVAIEHYNSRIYTSSTVGGNRSTGALTITWHHLVLTSTGLLYIDGVSYGGTSSTGLNSTIATRIGALNNNTGHFSGRIAEVALYGSVLTAERVLAHRNAGYAWSMPEGRTFAWAMESDRPEQFPPGSDDIAQYDQGAARTTAQAYAGAWSLDVSNAWRSATFDNPTPVDRWVRLDRGCVRFRFRYTGALSAQLMLFQITGKDRSGIDDTNDGRSCRLNPTNILFQGAQLNITPTPDEWHEVICRYRSDQAPYASITVDGVTATHNSASAAPTCLAWHHLLIGNDLANVPGGLWIDDFEAFGSYEGPDASSGDPAIAAAGGIASAAAWGTPSAGAVVVASEIPSAEAWGVPLLGASALVPEGIASAAAWGTPAVAAALAAAGTISAEAHGTPALGAVLAPSGIDTAETHGGAAVGAQVAPAAIAAGSAWGTPSLGGAVAAGSIASSEAWGTPSLAAGSLGPSGIASAEAWGTPGLGAVVAAAGVASAETWGSAAAGGQLAPSATPSTEAWGAPSISLAIGAGSIATGEAWGSPSLVPGAIAPSGIVSAEAWGAATLEARVVPQALPSAEAWGAASVAVTISPAGLVSAEAHGLPVLMLRLAPGAIASGEAWGRPVIDNASPAIPATWLVVDRRLGVVLAAVGASAILEPGRAAAVLLD